MKKFASKGIAVAAVCAATLGLMTLGVSPASADPAPSGSDIVGVGSDTLQYMLDFIADGDALGDNGYNAGKLARIYSFDATPDANARAGYLNGSTASSLKALNPTIVLRGGTLPRQRPNGSGAGLLALEKDSGASRVIDFARSSGFTTQSDVNTATGAGGVGDIHEVRLAKDTIGIAEGKTTNAVPLNKTQLFNIYQCTTGYTHWNDTNIGGTSANTIVPVIPQVGSGTRKTFLQDIGFTVNPDNSVSPALGGCVKTYEENDPYALFLDASGNQVADPYVTNLAANPDAIEPMSGGRQNLYATGYFYNPNVALGKAVTAGDDTVLNPQVQVDTRTGAYSLLRGLYVVFREADITSAAKFNGSTKNWVQTLFLNTSGGTPFVNSSAGQALLSAAGVTPDYGDCGKDAIDTSTCPPL